MSEQRYDGGPALPYEHKEWDSDEGKWRTQYIHGGMTLRDYFAAKAMQGFIASYPNGGAPCGSGDAWTIAEDAYEMANAMLKAREA